MHYKITHTLIIYYIMNFKSLIVLFISVLSIITVLSCGEEDTIETDAELQPYFDIFTKEASARGYTVDYEAARIEGLLQDIPNANIQGQCFRNESKPRKVIIDVNYWNNADEFEKQFIIFHELGHCFLDRDHLDTTEPNGICTSIMHSNPAACPFEFTNLTRDNYLDELFQ